jgi:hypothetical protein
MAASITTSHGIKIFHMDAGQWDLNPMRPLIYLCTKVREPNAFFSNPGMAETTAQAVKKDKEQIAVSRG